MPEDMDQILQRWKDALDKGVRDIVAFAKQVDGFEQLTSRDQMKLMKRNRIILFVNLALFHFVIDY